MSDAEATYEPAAPPKSTARHVMPDGSPAPTCFVRFRCPRCNAEIVEDAFLGPVGCKNGHSLEWKIEALGIVRSTPHPDSYTRHAEKLEKIHEQFTPTE